jgi:putative nucleotidyltransferase with HDIG domain
MEEEDADIEKIARIIQVDPAITSRLIHVANSALFASHQPVSTCIEAVLRLGLNTTRNLVICFTLGKLFKTGNRFIKNYMRDLWKHCTRVAAISYVLASQKKGFNRDHALLAGLLHDIGTLAILNYAEKYPMTSDSEEKLVAVIRKFHSDIGAMILEQWGFGDDIIECARHADDYDLETNSGKSYLDIIQVAQLHSYLGSKHADTLPSIPDTPAFIRLFSSDNNPEVSLKILEDAHNQIKEVMSWLTEK